MESTAWTKSWIPNGRTRTAFAPAFRAAGFERRIGARKDDERLEVGAASEGGREVVRPLVVAVGPRVQDEDLGLGGGRQALDPLPCWGLQKDPVAMETQDAAQQEPGVLTPPEKDRRCGGGRGGR